MLTIVLSLLFGFIAFAALAQVCFSVREGTKRGRLILAELARARPVTARPARRPRPAFAAA